MRNLLAFLAAAALTVAGLGWYLDWYRVQATPTDAGHRKVNIDIDTNKIGDDLHRGGEQILERGGEQIQKNLDKNQKPAAAEAGKALSGN